jgi:hypothetical protein
MTRHAYFVAYVALASAFGCGDADTSPTAIVAPATERLAVVGGERSGPGAEDAVLLLHGNGGGRELICSASLVAKNLVVTARHCVSHLTEGLFRCSTRGELIEAEPPDAGRLGMHLPADTFEFFGGPPPHDTPVARGKQVLSTLSDTICTNDVAFVVLDRDVDLPILPLRLDGRAQRGEVVTLVGYGLDETMDPRDPFDLRLQERTRRGGLTIAGVGPDSVEDVTATPPRMIVLEGPSGCLGDSGGPLISSETHALLGIYSLLDGETCVAPNLRHLFGHLPSFPALTEQAFAAAEAEPVREAAPSAGGAGGEPGMAGEAGASAGEAGGAGTPDDSAGAGGEPAMPTAGGEGGLEQPSSGGTTGTPPPSAPKRRASSGCSLTPAPEQPSALALIALLLAAQALRWRRLSAGCRADLLPALPRP